MVQRKMSQHSQTYMQLRRIERRKALVNKAIEFTLGVLLATAIATGLAIALIHWWSCAIC